MAKDRGTWQSGCMNGPAHGFKARVRKAPVCHIGHPTAQREVMYYANNR